MIEFRIGPLYPNYPNNLAMAPAGGTLVPRPFDVQHIPRRILGRNSGGRLMLSRSDAMQWVYRIGTMDTTYDQIRALYSFTNPRVWVHTLDLYTGEGAWYQATMHEPTLTRGGGDLVIGCSVLFSSMKKP